MEKVERFVEKFIPENYNLFLDINRKKRIFTGKVIIRGKALKKNVSLHQTALDIKEIKVAEEKLNFTVDNENDAVHFEVPKTGEISISVDFAGKIIDKLVGLYPSYYTENGVKKEIISTKFESHWARQMLPMIDEPVAKASYDLAVKFDNPGEGELVIANMPEIEVEKRKETGIWRFATTPKMSSYLLAFALGDLQSKKAKTKNGTEVGIFSSKAHPIKALDFALDIAVRSIEFYEEYFGVKYPLPHSYHIALPDFVSGAMENWGLITYREVVLLVDENSTVSSRQLVAIVIAHEVAHQWFGNLVTMKWWDDLWLNESFANMMEYVCIDSIEPSWNIFENFQTGGVGAALKRDATDGVQSVHVAVNHPDEISTLFDPAIVYAKGSRLMHMVRKWLGDPAFSKGLGTYFSKFKYSNTIGKDLWDELGKAANKDVAGFMNCWLDQSGYPVLNAKIENDKLIISQKQFFIGKNVDKNRIWQVPLNSNWEGIPETLKDFVLEIPKYSEVKSKNNGSLRFNTENTAHYIINYQGELFDSILADFSNLDKITKLQILQDTALLAEGGEVSYTTLAEFLAKLTDEKSYVVYAGIQKIISNLKVFIDEGTKVEERFKSIVAKIAKSNFDRLGFKAKVGENDEDEMLRQSVISMMIYADDKTATKQASEIFEEYKDNLESIPAYIRSFVLANEINNNEKDAIADKYIDLYVKTVDSNFKSQLMIALSKTKSENTMKKVLVALQDKDIVKPQDLVAWYGSFLVNEFSQEKIWSWSIKNWDWIKTVLSGSNSFDSFAILPAQIFKSKKRLTEYKEFFEPKLNDLKLSRSIAMGINQIEAKVKLIAKEKAIVEKSIFDLEI